MAVNITGSSFDDLAKALNKVNAAAKRATISFDKLFNMDFTNSKLMTSVTGLNTKMVLLNARARGLLSTLKEVKNLNINKMSGGGGSGGSGGSSGSNKPPKSVWQSPFSLLFGQQTASYRQRLVLNDLFGFKSNFGIDPGSSGNPLMVSRFGNPGQMPLVTRFRVFQRPFPGSERNPFALGDAGNILNNSVYSAGRSLEGMFKTLTYAGTDSVRLFTGLGQVGLSVATSLGTMIPGIGQVVGLIGTTLMGALEIFSKTLTHVVESMGKVIGGLLNFATNLGLAVSGLASRAVQAASNLTELKNAAAIYVGAGGGALASTAMDYQAKYGLSATDSLRLMTRVAGQVRQTTGVGGEQASRDAIAIFNSVAEAGSVLNMSIDDMGKIVQSALAGRYTPLRRIGVAVSAPYLDSIAKQMGFDKNAKTPFEARTKALNYEILRQTKPFMGDLAATQYEFANQQRKLLGMFEGIFVQAGRILEPFAKALLIVSNDVLGRLYNNLRGFADGVDDAVKATVGGGGGGLGEALRTFVHMISRAGDYVIHFASKLYDAREVITGFVGDFIKKVSGVAINLVKFSSAMVSSLIGLIQGFGSLIPSIEMTTNAFVTMADWFNWFTGNDPRNKALRMFEQDEIEVRDYSRRRGEYLAGTHRFMGLSDEKMFQSLKDQYKGIISSEPKRKEVNQLISSGMSKSEAAYQVYGSGNIKGFSDALKSGVDTLNDVAKRIQAGNMDFQKLVEVPPEYISGVLDKVAMQNLRSPTFESPPELSAKPSSLATYFDPAKFRDEIQSRQVSAAEQTAENTAMIVELLKPDGFKENALMRPTPGFTTK